MDNLKSFKPMLACNDTLDVYNLVYPVLVSVKYDGIRCINHPALGPVSRDLKPIPNEWIRKQIEDTVKVGLEGEIVTYGEDNTMDDFNTVQKKVMTASGEPVFVFLAFDNILLYDTPARVRKEGLTVLQELVHNPEELLALEAEALGMGAEGLMICDPDGLYKWGRSTLREGLCLKLVRKKRDEAVVVGLEQLMHNDNEKTVGNLGQAKRSSHKANKRPSGLLGALVVEWQGLKFKIGTGFSQALRKEIWEARDVIGKKVTFEFRGVGSKGRPRFPSFIGFRLEAC